MNVCEREKGWGRGVGRGMLKRLSCSKCKKVSSGRSDSVCDVSDNMGVCDVTGTAEEA